MHLLFLSLFSFAQAEPIWPDISQPIPNVGYNTSKDSALIISIENYDDIPDVKGAVQNGKDWEQYFLKSAKIPVHRVQHLKNKDAYQEKIIRTAEKLVKSTPAGGKIWLVFIGHGANHKGEPIFVDVDARQEEASFEGQLTQRRLLEILGESHEVVALIDACFSGQDNQGLALLSGTQFAAPTSLLDIPQTTILTAADKDEYAGSLVGLDRPAFSYLALGAMRGWADENKDQKVSLTEVRDYVDYTMQAVISDREQTPTLTGKGDLVVSKVKEKGPDLIVVREKLSKEEDNSGGFNPDDYLDSSKGGSSGVSVKGGGADDLDALLKQANRLEREAKELENGIIAYLDAEEVAVKAKAKSKWNDTKFQNFRGTNPDAAARAVKDFVQEYSNVEIKYEGALPSSVKVPTSRKITITEISLATEWLKQNKIRKEKDIQTSLDQQEQQIKTEAKSKWNDASFQKLRKNSPDLALKPIEAFLNSYGNITITYEGNTEDVTIATTRKIEIPEVTEARSFLTEPKGFAVWTKECNQGKASSCFSLGWEYELGEKVGQDYKKAASLYKKACDGGDMGACNNLGLRYLNGQGVTKDKKKAAVLYQKSCDGGNMYGCNSLGWAYVNGQGVIQDKKRGAALYKKACTSGNISGCNSLGWAYANGQGLTKDYQKAVSAYQKSCDGKNMEACGNLGIRYANGQGVTKDYKKAVSLYTKSCDGNYMYACYSLGWMYEQGKGVTLNYKEAYSFYKKACDGGNMNGCHNLGLLYEDGKGVTQNYKQAAIFYEKACNNGNAGACNNLGIRYQNGQGVTKDNKKAALFYQKSCDGGSKHGCFNLAGRYSSGLGVSLDKKQAALYYKKSCDAGYQQACVSLGRLK